ncbi:MAG TPA: sialidase family protein, partial [Pirellulaceae bacterium]|nr:sialidase family protein [Pirellulaceae bacterium]
MNHYLPLASAAAGILLWTATLFAEAPLGVVIDFSPAKTKQYIGSPSIAILADGAYVASHDFFSPGNQGDRTLVFRSTDRGQSWRRVADRKGQWWSGLFVHRGKLYLMGTSQAYGKCVIRRSDDSGTTWTEPKDGKT